ncbi:Basal-body rod modification protein FlgD [Thalassovita gelatinovora]|uniref:Basal-body rod modification protein FlgD n=1 Tax=Thalassovita gelatinovora TaxID=53501 RepID=A0A0P1FL68_THAGE|nr:flagellar hook capping FlgD N-terminal domain-containing protein [Thalassovita gelatinovora]QIZ78992.1 flagellar biosynthesis protein FlgD [Thalassovita gelatinovora]CUH68532.1 Basal-body rod modification protein FlgD [Thalassovita gelatinovora]SEQ54151.1 flagellar basal-body rod modification protein FlgD [Thalassovita gelatinovora]
MTDTSISGYSGVRTLTDMNASSAATNSTDTMGSSDFLTLLTTQLQNQDPFQPMENGEFLSQLAQMSTVRGIDDLNATMGAMATSSQISEASSMLGQRALVDGSVVRADETGNVAGRAILEQDAESVVVTYTDADTGDILHSDTVTNQYSGNVDFSWDNAPTDGRRIRVNVSATTEDGTQDASTQVYALIESVELNASVGGMTLQIQDYGAYLGSEITALR